MRVEDFDYVLPEELIAQSPADKRSDSRLLVVDPVTESMEHRHFWELPAYLQAGDVLVFNNSKVLQARLHAFKPDTGASVELLLTRPQANDEWLVMAKPAKRLKVGTELVFRDSNGREFSGAKAIVTGVADDGMRTVRFFSDSFAEFLDACGEVPLPPYIHAKLQDKDRYQTVYADPLGSVAAPTAGLHFTDELLDKLRCNGIDLQFITLHVGVGTFKPVSAETVEEHVMHTETYAVSEAAADAITRAKREGRRVIAVGTTALRTLESAAADGGGIHAGTADTGIFIYPGYSFRVVDALITNFHLPKSTLLMLVAAMMGLPFTKAVYETAVAERYRFFSFGDSMFISRRLNG